MKYKVTLYRANGREVKSKEVDSKYAAKALRKVWEAKYDETYYVETTELPDE